MPNNANSKFKADTFNVLEFMGPSETGFVIPIYQRSYSWKTDKVFDLLNDIIGGVSLIKENSSFDEYTYIGGIITTNGASHTTLSVQKKTPKNVYSLVDGQQRISTIVIIALALLPELSCFRDNILVAPLSNEEKNQILEFVTALIDNLEQITLGQSFGSSNKFPKVIRSSEDIWGENDETLVSPISKLSRELYNYKIQNNGSFSNFSPRGARNEHNHPLKRLKDINKEINLFIAGNDSQIFGKIPKINSNFQNIAYIFSEIFKCELSQINYLDDDSDTGNIFSNRFRLAIFSHYFLNRVALTKVHGDSEYFAFEVFESLNTSGEPLNAYETLKPLIIKELALSYSTSQQRDSIDAIDRIHNSLHTIDKRQKLVSDSIILFVTTESGDKISKSLNQQSRSIRDLYTNFPHTTFDHNSEKIKYLKLLRNSTEISQLVNENRFSITGNFCNILDNESKLCLSLLIDTRHTLALSLINRFYFEFDFYMNSSGNYITSNDVNSVIKAVTSFSILWRVAWGGTAGIDTIYRNLMSNTYSRRASSGRLLSIIDFKAELVKILFKNNGVGQTKILNKGGFINISSKIPIFLRTKKVAKFMLLAAQHDSQPDPITPGFLTNGNIGTHTSLTYENYIADENYTLEHIAPQVRGLWPGDLYDDPHTVHRFGNLILMPIRENLILNNRPWIEKQVLFKALCAQLPADRESEINKIIHNLNSSAVEKIKNARYMPTLDALARVDNWDLDIINKRTDQILSRGYDKLMNWLV